MKSSNSHQHQRTIILNFVCLMITVIFVHLKLLNKDVGFVKYFGLSVLVTPDFTIDKKNFRAFFIQA